MSFLRLIAALLLALILAKTNASAEPVDADILLVEGTIYDGTGSPGSLGNVAIRGDRIVAGGKFDAGKVGTPPHPPSFGTFSRKIGRYTIQEKVISPEQAIRSAAGLAADIIGMNDRGYLRKNYFADAVVSNSQSFLDHVTCEKPFERSTGVRYLVVKSKLAIDEGDLTVTDAGRPLRKKPVKLNL